MKNFPEVKTHLLRVPDSTLAQMLPGQFYHSTSDNCARMLQGPYGGNFAQKNMNVLCTTKWNNALNPYDYETAKRGFRLGLPESFYENNSTVGS